MAVATFTPFVQPGAPLDTGVLHQPAFALKHFTHQRPRDSAAAHLYALICERLGLVDEAVTALENAVELLEQEFEHSESVEIEHRYTAALLNLGRVRLSSRASPSSLDAFTNCFELLSGSQHPDAGKMRVQARLGQGLAQFWVGQVDESLEAFQAALDESNGQDEKEVVAVLLARTLWGLGGDEAKDLAKSQLMEWSVFLEHESGRSANARIVYRPIILQSRSSPLSPPSQSLPQMPTSSKRRYQSCTNSHRKPDWRKIPADSRISSSSYTLSLKVQISLEKRSKYWSWPSSFARPTLSHATGWLKP